MDIEDQRSGDHPRASRIGPCVLVVEDDRVTRSFVGDALTDAGYRVSSLPGGLPALEEATRRRYDLVICDLDLPDVTGFEVLAALRRDGGNMNTPILVMSGHTDLQSRLAAFAAGADCFLAKPFILDEVLAICWSLARRAMAVVPVPEAGLLGVAAVLDAAGCVSLAHMRRTGFMASLFARWLGESEADQRALVQAGYVHDLGNLVVSPSVLRKPARLDEAEWDEVRRHPREGARLSRNLTLLAGVRQVVLHHHEHWDGSGYPDGLAGDAIPRLARIFQLADAFDALSSERPYRAALSRDEALGTLTRESECGQWDPGLCQAFVLAMGAGMWDEHGSGGGWTGVGVLGRA